MNRQRTLAHGGRYGLWFLDADTPSRALECVGVFTAGRSGRVTVDVLLEERPGFLLEVHQSSPRFSRWDEHILDGLGPLGETVRRRITEGRFGRWVKRTVATHRDAFLHPDYMTPWLRPSDRLALQTSIDLRLTNDLLRRYGPGRAPDVCYDLTGALTDLPGALNSRWTVIHIEMNWAIAKGVGVQRCPCGRWFFLAGPRGIRATYCHPCRKGYAAQRAYRARLKEVQPFRFTLMEERRKKLARVRHGTLSRDWFRAWKRDVYDPGYARGRQPGT